MRHNLYHDLNSGRHVYFQPLHKISTAVDGRKVSDSMENAFSAMNKKKNYPETDENEYKLTYEKGK